MGLSGNLSSLASCHWCWLVLLAGMLKTVFVVQDHGKEIAQKLKVHLCKVTLGSGQSDTREWAQ